ncbi:MAG: hypothetical protein GFH27_549349n41 [Chloroflexi bacterium AL-W]|nr:hypothetical protein [Chloroflexi bacterium AL-N1]NOK69939.1 hypothetical protein [Chloroflexi bacterium AL-N10]NOK73765.1 hypothetical protein [Chloroflexi bacterium AL-N5]NOK85471.1 hypothetical protein [Chloroflexi bacterium AL-W]NOK91672.1 hypothetical protein [Chloroflexi bacterium AL-N15]
MPKWNDFQNIWTTLREVDVTAIRDEAEKPVNIACVGHQEALQTIKQLLHTGSERYGPVSPSPITLVSISETKSASLAIQNADLLILGVDAHTTLTEAETQGFQQLNQLATPYLVVITNGDYQTSDIHLPNVIDQHVWSIPDPSALDAPDHLAEAVLQHLPGDIQLAAARRLPALRTTFTRESINNASLTNATYAIVSGLPQQIPVLGIPFAAADIIILTKNQAMLVYRMALAYGAPPDFQSRMHEIIPVVGGAFLWRQAARSLIGLIPFWGLAPKIAIAYAGTYATGIVAWRWYSTGELVSADQVKRISQEALVLGRTRAQELVNRVQQARRTRSTKDPITADKPGWRARLKRLISRRGPSDHISTSDSEQIS